MAYSPPGWTPPPGAASLGPLFAAAPAVPTSPAVAAPAVPVLAATPPPFRPLATTPALAAPPGLINIHTPTIPKGMPVPWQHISVGHQQALTQIAARQSGALHSLLTPWSNFNDVGMNGLEWNTMNVIAARPGQGKTLCASMITNNAHRLNPTQDFLVLDFQWEMLSRSSAMRELSGHLGLSLKQLNSAERNKATGLIERLSPIDYARAEEYAKTQEYRKHFVIEKAMTPDEVGRTLENFYKVFKLPILATFDHSMLAKKGASDKDKVEMLQSFGAVITDVKRRLPLLAIVLSQLGRTLEDYTRQEKPGSHGNYPNEGDLFGGDALMQHADLVCLLNRPAKYNLAVYGPDKFQVTSPNLLAAHFIKARSGQTCIGFFEAEFAKMNLREVAPPPVLGSTAAPMVGRTPYKPPGAP